MKLRIVALATLLAGVGFGAVAQAHDQNGGDRRDDYGGGHDRGGYEHREYAHGGYERGYGRDDDRRGEWRGWRADTWPVYTYRPPVVIERPYYAPPPVYYQPPVTYVPADPYPYSGLTLSFSLPLH